MTASSEGTFIGGHVYRRAHLNGLDGEDPEASLLLAQRLHGFYRRGSAGRQIAGQQGRKQEDQPNDQEG